MLFKNTVITAGITLLACAGLAQAGVSADQAARLGQDLTPMGAEKAGNAAGTIPAWNGGLTQAPASYGGPDSRYTNPFPNDQPNFFITSANYQQYADNLSEGQIALLQKWPNTYKLPVYETRRSFANPQWIYDTVRDNAVNSQLTADGEGIANATGGVPFPFPEAMSDPAKAVVWNHKLRYRGQDITRTNVQIVTVPGGGLRTSKLEEDIKFLYSQRGIKPSELNNTSIYFLQVITAPPRSAGQILLVHETLNQVEETRRAWLYNPGQRRIRRAPNVAYDNPGNASDGMRTNDQFDMYNGATDRYNWKLLGKREMYVPYNSYQVYQAPNYESIIGDKHVNQDLTRYELHRVWVVEANVREGTSHIFAKRKFYVDEDSWTILLADQWDSRGNLWRIMEDHTISAYDQPVNANVMEISYDLFSDRYLVGSLTNEEEDIGYNVEYDREHFNPRNVQRKAIK